MAGPDGMSGIDLAAVVSELEGCLPLWIGKIYQFDSRTIGIRLNGEERKRYQLLLEAGRRVHLVRHLPEAPLNPTGFAMFLRRHLSGGRVLRVMQIGIQRILFLEVGKRETALRLYMELFDEGNAILCDEGDRILMPLRFQEFRERKIAPGERYVLPAGTDCTSLGWEEFVSLLRESGREIVRVLASECMLGGPYAEEICRRLNIPKQTPSREIDPAAVRGAILGLLREVREVPAPVITASGCWPILFPEERALERFGLFSDALEKYYGAAERRDARKRQPLTLPKDEAIRLQQQRAIARFDQEIARLQRCVEAVYEHYRLVEEAIRVLGEAIRHHSWGEIEARLRASGDTAAARIVAFHPAESAIELDLGVRVKIHVRESIQENLARYYEAIKKFRRKREGAIAAMSRPVARKEKKKKMEARARKRWYHRFRWFFTSDGALVVGGRDADQNEELVRRYMEGQDLFLHADVHGGSVTLLKGGKGSLEEAASFAASYSGAWKSGHLTADVYVVRPEQVSKAAPAGEYLPKGGFMVRGERQYIRHIPLGIAIGLQLEPEAEVIGGPTGAVAKRAKVWVELRPGPYEPNDATKKALRLLRERLEERGLGEYSRVLNTQAVLAFIPPGGSEVF